jgi:hypothetical protein
MLTTLSLYKEMTSDASTGQGEQVYEKRIDKKTVIKKYASSFGLMYPIDWIITSS